MNRKNVLLIGGIILFLIAIIFIFGISQSIAIQNRFVKEIQEFSQNENSYTFKVVSYPDLRRDDPNIDVNLVTSLNNLFLGKTVVYFQNQEPFGHYDTGNKVYLFSGDFSDKSKLINMGEYQIANVEVFGRTEIPQFEFGVTVGNYKQFGKEILLNTKNVIGVCNIDRDDFGVKDAFGNYHDFGCEIKSGEILEEVTSIDKIQFDVVIPRKTFAGECLNEQLIKCGSGEFECVNNLCVEKLSTPETSGILDTYTNTLKDITSSQPTVIGDTGDKISSDNLNIKQIDYFLAGSIIVAFILSIIIVFLYLRRFK